MEFVRNGDELLINGVSLVPGPTPAVLDYDLRMIPTDNPGVYSYDLGSISKDGAALTSTFAEVLKKDIRNQVQLQLKEMTLFQDFTEESGFDAFLAGGSGIRNVDFVEFGDGSFGYQTFDDAGTLIAVTRIENGKAVRQTMSGETEVRETFAPDGTHDVEVLIGDGRISTGQIGSIFGSTIGRQLTDDALGSIALGTVLGAVGQNLLQILGFSALDGNSVGDAIDDAFGDLGIDLTNAAKGAVSSFLVGELMAEIGIDGIAGEVVNTVGGDALATIANNILGGASTSAEIFSGIDPTTVMASFVGAKLASEVVNFDTIGGQIGASAGSSIGVVLAAKNVIFTSLGPFGLLAGAFAGFIVGGVVGSLFGGTPRSGADVTFDPATGEFDVTNVWAKKGGSKEAAEGLATAAAEALNGVLGLIGGEVVAQGRVSGGSYGLRKSDYTYRVDGGAFGPGDPGKRTIARTFDGDEEDAAAQLIEHGVLNALDDLRIAGGDVYLKRALYTSLDSLLLGDDVPAGLEGEALGALYGNLATAGDYKTYVENAAAINAIMAAEPDSAFAAGWIVTLQRVSELGLNKRHAADWLGGWGAWATTHGVESYGQLDLGVALNGAGQAERLFSGLDENGIGFRILDTVTQGSRDVIAGTAGADTITLTGDMLAGDASLSVNGVAQDGTDMRIDTAATVHGGAGNDVIIGGDLGNELFGDGGDDLLRGGLKDDWLFGGAGADRLYADGGDGNYLDGGAGNDELYGALGSDWLDGGAGVDVLDGNAGDDILTGGAGDGDQLRGGSGDDSYLLRLGDGKDVIEDVADQGAPTVSVKQRLLDIDAGIIARNWAGGEAFDATNAYVKEGGLSGGEDTLVLGRGIGLGDISITRSGDASAPGNDLVLKVIKNGVATGDEIVMTDWFVNDYKKIERLEFADGQVINIGNFASFTLGTDGNDYIIGTAGSNFVHGGSGNDVAFLLWGDDVGIGGTGDDWLSGGSGRDIVIGGDQNDVVDGNEGDDVVAGGRGDDNLYGGSHNDILAGDEGDDIVVGGFGDDIFKFSRGDGRDVIFDAYSPNWETIFTDAGYQNGYYRDPVTLEIKDAGGNVAYDGTNWTFRVFYDLEQNILKRHLDNGATDTADQGQDRLEFGVGVDINDIQMEWRGDDLVLGIEGYGQDPATFASIRDIITLKEWGNFAFGSKPIETFTFFNTGALDTSEIDNWGIGATDGDDSILGGLNKDWLTGNGGDDTIDGLTGDDILNGNAGQDILIGDMGDDVLLGGSGNDILNGGAGADVLVGGVGDDRASYADSVSGVIVSLDDYLVASGEAANDTFHGIEGLIGSDYADTLGGDQNANILQGGKGDDHLYGQLGDDIYLFNRGDGSDTIHEQSHLKETVVDAEGNLQSPYEADWQFLGMEDLYFGSDPLFSYRLVITDGRTGEAVYSQILTSSGYRTVPDYLPASGWINGYTRSGNGQEVVHTATGMLDGGDDVLEFGEGISLSDLEFSQNNLDLQISLKGTTDSVTIQKFAASYARIESLELADGLAVNLGGIVLDGVGAAGDDFLAGTAGADSLSGGDGHDVLSGGDGNDSLAGDLGDDILEGGAGADSLDGGAGMDMVRYNGSASGVTVDLSSATAASGGDAAGDMLVSIENIMGSSFNDTLSGDAADNQIFGRAGNDALRGGAGADVLKGDEGDDALYGDGGEDNLFGGAGGDTLEGGTEKDSLFGGEGHDTLRGDAGDDSLYGEAGNDTLEGGEGNDVLYGGRGADMLRGGLGDDSYLFGRNDGQNTIIDASGANEIAFEASDVSYDQLWFSRSGDDLIIEVIDGDTRVTLQNYYAAGTALRRIVTSSHSLSGDQMDDLVAAMAGRTIGDASKEITATRSAVWQDNFLYVDRYVIKGNSSNNTLSADGGQGNYYIYGFGGNDTLTGGVGDDHIFGGAGVDVLNGESGNDYFYFEGLNGSYDSIIGGSGNDSVIGSEEDDVISFKDFSGIELIDGKSGYNTLTFSIYGSRNLDLSNVALTNINLIKGTSAHGGDVIRGSQGDDIIEGVAGSDQLFGEGGNDSFLVSGNVSGKYDGGLGFDIIQGGDSDDVITLNGIENIEAIDGGGGNNILSLNRWGSLRILDVSNIRLSNIDLLRGSTNTETIKGTSDNDVIDGGGGGDSLYGLEGNDLFYSNVSGVKYFGGQGIDTVSLSKSSTYAADINLTTGIVDWLDTIWSTETLDSIENIIGSVNGDAITGDAGNNVLDGHAGDDEIWGGAGDDVLIGGAGTDILHGGLGSDTADFSRDSVGRTIDLTTGQAYTPGGFLENFDGIENIVGTASDDIIVGDGGINILSGSMGNDAIDGGAGPDTAAFSGAYADYDISFAADGSVVVTDMNLLDGDDGMDSLTNIEYIRFSDQTVNLAALGANPPYVAAPLPDLSVNQNETVNYAFPLATFGDLDGDPLVFSASLADGSVLPSWLSFDAANRAFSGLAGNSEVGSYDIKVSASDGEYSASDIFTLSVQNINDAPTSITLTGGSAVDETVDGYIFGSLAVSDPDDIHGGDFAEHALTVDDNRFEIVAGQLKLRAGVSLDYETDTPLTVRVTATDRNGAGLSSHQDFAITVHDINETPTDILLSNTVIDEETPAGTVNGTVVGQVFVADQDLGDTHTLTLLNDAGGRFYLDAVTNEIKVLDSSLLDAEAAESHVVTLQATDSAGNIFQKNHTITVNDLNEAPVEIQFTGSFNVNENNVAANLGLLSVNDPDRDTAGDFAQQQIVIQEVIGGIAQQAENSRFEYDAATGNLRLKSGAFLDYETEPTVTVRITATDQNGAGLSVSKDYTFNVQDQIDVIHGDEFANILSGAWNVDHIFGHGGNDEISGLGGNDELYGEAGADTIYGGDGADLIKGGSEDDVLYGDAGNDTIYGEAGNDTLEGGAGHDALQGDAGNDILRGGAGDDVLKGGTGADHIYGGDGADHLYGGLGNDFLYGNNGNDTYYFDRTTGHDTVDNFDMDGSIDAITFSFSEDAIDYYHLWFEKTGATNQDLKVTILGADASITIVNWFDAQGNSQRDFVIDEFFAGVRFLDNRLGSTDVDQLVAIYETVGDGSAPDLMVSEVPSSIRSQIDIFWGFDTPPTITEIADQTIDEDVPSAALAFTVGDAQTPADSLTITYSSSDQSLIADGDILLGGVGQNRTLQFTPRPDSYGAAIISITVTDQAGQQAQTEFMVTVNSVNDAPEIAAQTLNVDENSLISVDVGTVTATDRDSDQYGDLRYSFKNGTNYAETTADGLFRIDPLSGQVTVNTASLNHESVGGDRHAYEVAVRDNAGLAGYNETTASLFIDVNDVNEAPVANNQSMSVLENASTGTAVGTVYASDEDEGAYGDLRYYFKNGGSYGATSSDGMFKIDAMTGAVTVNTATLNREAVALYTYTIAVRDNAGAAGYHERMADLEINIDNDPEPPTTPTIQTWYNSSADENIGGLTVAGLSSTDPEGDAITYQIVGNPKGAFQIVNGNQLKLIDPLNYEDPAVGGSVTVQVKAVANGQSSGILNVPFTVNPVDEAPSQPGVAVIDNSVLEGNYSSAPVNIATLSATDPENNPVTYELVNNPGGAFSVSGNTLKLTGILDYESVGAAANVQVRAKANGKYSPTRSIAVSVVNVDEAPNAPGVASINTTVAENTSGIDIASLSATDPDGDAVSYVITNNPGNAFAMVGNKLRLTGSLNYEEASSVNVQVKSFANGKYSSAATIPVSVTDINEEFILTYQPPLDVPETAGVNYSVGTISAPEDPDSGAFGSFKYQFVTSTGASGISEDGKFVIDSASGEISVNGGLDYETTTEYSYDVKVWDNNGAAGANSKTATVVIPVVDVNEPPTLNTHGTLGGTANAGKSITLGYFEVFDPEGSASINIKEITKNITLTSGTMIPSFGYMKSTTADPTISKFTITAYIPKTQQDHFGSGTITYKPNDGLYDGNAVTINVSFHFNGVWDNGVPVPVALDLDGDGVELISVTDSKVKMDVDGDGKKDKIGWISGDDGWLALDRNGSGEIDAFNEISFIGDTPDATTDLEGLRAYDTNGNGLLDAQDERFGEFLVWRDVDEDGVSDDGELETLAEAGIRAIELAPTPTGDTVEGATDNVITGTSRYLTPDGRFGQVGDVALAYIDKKGRKKNIVDKGNKKKDNVLTPVVFDLKDDGIDLLEAPGSKVRFDADNDGVRETVGWIGEDEAFLALDRNNNGIIDSGVEISFVDDLAGARTDLEGLVAYDSNGDGMLDANDDRFADFLMWRDKNQNGISETDELMSLEGAGVASINLSPAATGNTLTNTTGNVLINGSEYTRTDGATAALGDVALRYVNDPEEESSAPPVEEAEGERTLEIVDVNVLSEYEDWPGYHWRSESLGEYFGHIRPRKVWQGLRDDRETVPSVRETTMAHQLTQAMNSFAPLSSPEMKWDDTLRGGYGRYEKLAINRHLE